MEIKWILIGIIIILEIILVIKWTEMDLEQDTNKGIKVEKYGEEEAKELIVTFDGKEYHPMILIIAIDWLNEDDPVVVKIEKVNYYTRRKGIKKIADEIVKQLEKEYPSESMVTFHQIPNTDMFKMRHKRLLGPGFASSTESSN